MMTWTDERIEALRAMWEAGQTASQIAEALGGVSRNAVIGKAHRLNLQARPSPVKANEPAADPAMADPFPEPVPAAEPVAAVDLPETDPLHDEVPVPDMIEAAAPDPVTTADEARVADPSVPFATDRDTGPEHEARADEPDADDADDAVDADGEVAAPRAPDAPPPPVMRSVGPGGFVRQSPGEQQPPIAPAPPRRLVPAKPSAEVLGKTSLLDLNDKICKWPIGHPGEPDFHFCGRKVNPGFPYCIEHCGHAYQAQLPRRDRRGPPPLPFGGPRTR